MYLRETEVARNRATRIKGKQKHSLG
jgi:hypothetical protein